MTDSKTVRFNLKLSPEENAILNEKAKKTGQSKAGILKRSLYRESSCAEIPFRSAQLIQMLYRMDSKLRVGDIDGAREEIMLLCDTLSL